MEQADNYSPELVRKLIEEGWIRLKYKYGADQWQYRNIFGTFTVGMTKEEAITRVLKAKQLHKSFIQCIGRDNGCECKMSRRCDCGAPVGFMNLDCDYCKACVKENLLKLGTLASIETICAFDEFKNCCPECGEHILEFDVIEPVADIFVQQVTCKMCHYEFSIQAKPMWFVYKKDGRT